MPVAAFGEFLLNDVADQKDLAAAKEVGDYEGCQCRNKYHGDAADDAWEGPAGTQRSASEEVVLPGHGSD